MVEFALVLPLLVLLVFGIVEMGWAFGQHLDVRHGAREGARLAAVDHDPGSLGGVAQRDAIVAEICDRMNIAGGAAVTLVKTGPEVGDDARITAQAPLQTLTGLLDGALGGVTLRSSVEFRLEQDAGWADTDGAQACP